MADTEQKKRKPRQTPAGAGKKKTRILIVCLLAAAVAAAALFAVIKFAVPAGRYRSAEKLMAEGKYAEAAAAFEKLGDYRDSADRAADCADRAKFDYLNSAEVGSTVLFGRFEQDNDLENGQEPIEWLVLDRQEDRILVLSKYALDRQQFHDEFVNVTWETCSLRTWLNETFFGAAFLADEQSRILPAEVPADPNPTYDTPPGNSTTDRLFALSIAEVERYLPTDSERQCRGTDYCYAQGALEAENGFCWWWLRTPGSRPSYVVFVRDSGAVRHIGGSVYGLASHIGVGYGAVRPAMWVSLEP